MNHPNFFHSAFDVPQARARRSAAAQAPLCPGDVPLVLLPVRLETRFFSLPGNVTELRVRVYPDKIHLDSHEPDLSTDERNWGRHWVDCDWHAGRDETLRAQAWRQLADRFGEARAAWIARVMKPTNAAQRPDTTTPADQPLPVAPVYPALPPVGEGGELAWRSAPAARLLPDRWVAILHSAGKVALIATAKDIRRPLFVGPSPQTPEPDAATEAAIRAGEALAIDPGMAWMVDFNEAEAAGMALRITVPPALLSAGIDSLLVLGVAASADVADNATQLADLLDAHHHTDGLEFLPHGTPTNNSDQRRAGYSSQDEGHLRSLAHEVLTDPAQAPNAARVGTALGLPAERIAGTLGHIAQAAADHDRNLRSMNTALWPVGWGYFLTNMVGSETGLTPASVDWARGHFVNHVRAGGPFPALRCGAQPYGILPVTSLDLWAPAANEVDAPQQQWLAGMLKKLRDTVWRPALPGVARVGLRQSPPDPDADLADVMRTDAISHRHLARTALGRHLVEHLYALGAQDFATAARQQSAVGANVAALMGLDVNDVSRHPHLARLLHDLAAYPLNVPLVQPGEVSPWRLLEPNYITALLNERRIDALVATRIDPRADPDAASLLHALLRHALLREIANAAARLVATLPGPDLAGLLRDAELVDLVTPAPVDFQWQAPQATMHWRRQLELKVPAITGKLTVREYLEGLSGFTHPAVAALGEFRDSLAHLQTLDSDTLQSLMQGTLDLSAHRLDAWITSVATRRLSDMTHDGPQGQRVGAYGWVENLRMATAAAPVPDAALPPGERGPLLAPPHDSGFIHAPSLTHATAAALLRNAQLGPNGEPLPDGPFAIELTSRRVREATQVLDGVRQGQPLGALLGYRLERHLHELGLDRFIAPLRELAPLAVRAREADALPAEAIAANNVVDGWVLGQRAKASPADVDTALAAISPPPTAAERQLVDTELAALDDTIDGLGDALTAEAAYQMVRGNTSRLASTLSAIAQGDAPPPELEVARMPRSGTAMTHRLLVMFSGTPVARGGWQATGASPRANAERSLNAWVGRLLGDARKVRCSVEQLDDAGAVIARLHFPLSELPMTPLDFVCNLESAPGSTPAGDAPGAIEQWVLYQARRRPGGFGAQACLRLQHERPADLAAGELTLFDLLEQGRAVRRLLDGARGAGPEDLNPPSRSGQGTIDLVELEARSTRALSGLRAAHQRLSTLVAQGPAATAEDLRSGLLALGAYGLTPAVPSVAVGDDTVTRNALRRQCSALLKSSRERIDRSTVLRSTPLPTEPRARCARLIELERAVFGTTFAVLPNFHADTAGSTELRIALSASTAQQGGDPLAAHTWLTRHARVREPVSRLSQCLRQAEVLATGDRLALKVAQLPFVASERWVGLPPPPGQELPSDKLSLVVQASTALDPSLPMAGLLIDEWTEVVPGAQETSALTFQFDPPNACAPQNILIAVPPVPGQDWTTESLRRVLMETLDLAKLRAVDTGQLGNAAHSLPALYVPFNAADDAVSTDFAALTT